ncbi:hypothetical protein NS334_11180 [Sphingomonas endophytica]|uniref:M23ase beta-sheet core domain-containing protein n=2 Tax=Sphingomonas endophytica TaxID=869719 RepID=A0A147I0T6_9SPHN|nr:hypothetical protein NS334_11180 [Sphingomonas endophytica]
MGSARLWSLLACVALAGSAQAADDARSLAVQAREARARAISLERLADAIADPGERARRRETAVAARVAAAEADLALLRSHADAVARRLSVRRTALSTREAPTAEMLAALTSIARRPMASAIVQPGSVADLVHVRAVLDATLPTLRARSVMLRRQVADDRVLQASVGAAERQLRAGRARLVEAREQLAAITEGDDDRALAMEEAVRDTAERLATIGSEQSVLSDLLALPAPSASPPAASWAPAYRLPVRGRLVTGLGEVSGNGVRARGLTFATAAGATVIAPAAGRVRYVGPFRSFGRIVIIDHGAGWTTLVTGLGSVAVRAASDVAAGAPLGRAPAIDGARITVELRRRGRAMDIAQLAG